MSLYTGCTSAASLTAIPALDCSVSLAQVQRLIFQRVTTSGSRNEITDTPDDPAVLATWTALKAAVDSTKVVVTPILGNPVTDEAGFREFGGGNETPDGIPIRLDANPTPFSCRLYAATAQQDIAAAIEALAGESLQVYMVDSTGRIAGETDDVGTPTLLRGFKIRSLAVSDLILGGFDGVDYNVIQFELLPGWSRTLRIVEPSDFDALTEL